MRWDDVLAFELRFSREGHYPDRLVVHRKGTPGWQVGRGRGGKGVGVHAACKAGVVSEARRGKMCGAKVVRWPCPNPPPRLQEEESLAHQIKCFEGTPQASQVKLVAEKVRFGWLWGAMWLGEAILEGPWQDALAGGFWSWSALGQGGGSWSKLYAPVSQCCACTPWTRCRGL